MTTGRVATNGGPVVVTGIGLLTPLGDRLGAVAEALRARSSGLVPAPELGGACESRMRGFDASRYATVRGLRLYSLATRLGVCAAKLALDDARWDPAAVPGERLGVVTASTFGHLETLFEYDRSLVVEGLLRTNPALMPLGIPSAPGAAIALAFGAKACSMTVAGGSTGALDALGLGARLVAAGRGRACVVVASFALCPELSLAASRAGMLAPQDRFRPFDRRSAGTALGEGAAAVVLERRDAAAERGADAKALVLGQASTFAAEPDRLEDAFARAGASALGAAGIDPAEVAVVSSGASGAPATDRAEALALRRVLAGAADRAPLLAVKAALGETMDASGLLQALVALAALRDGRAPPIAGLEEPEVPGLRYATRDAPVDGRHALVTSSHRGACSALVLSAPDAA